MNKQREYVPPKKQPYQDPDRKSKFAPGTKIRIKNGVFTGFDGVVESLDVPIKVMVKVPVFGREVRVEVEDGDIETK